MRTTRLLLSTLTAAFALAVAADAATITVVNLDGAGEGFNDPTAVAPVGGNPGVTLGAQRLNACQFAADLWGAQLVSTVPITVGAAMDPLPCDASSAVLGQAGPTTVHRDFPGALVASTWYPQALANKLRGLDLAPATDDVGATFNSTIGTTCPFPKSWYYGFDASPGVNQTDFVTVVLHELGHGLGFLSLVDDSTGAKLLGFDDAYERLLEDHSVGFLWPPLSNAQRMASAIDTGDLHWTGAAVVANGGYLASGRHASGHIEMYAPNPLEPGSSVSHFSTSLSPDELMEPVYTGPLHATTLSRHLMTDVGWGAATATTTTTTSATSSSTTTTTLVSLIHHPQDALKLILKENTATGKEKAVWVSKTPPIVLPGSDPTAVGATFRVKNPGTGETGTTSLPAVNWGTNAAGSLYKFVNKEAPGGPSTVKVAVVKSGAVLKVVAKDALISLDEESQGMVGVDLTIGADRYCSQCAAPIKDFPGVYIAKGCPAPPACLFPSGAFLE